MYSKGWQWNVLETLIILYDVDIYGKEVRKEGINEDEKLGETSQKILNLYITKDY